MKLKVLIVDDEMLARRRLTRLLSAMGEVELVGECINGAAVLVRIREEPRPDVVLLDINMPGLTGVEAMELWPDDGPTIIFTTAHAEHALAAFDGGAVDYMLKPVEAGRLKKALDRVTIERVTIERVTTDQVQPTETPTTPAPDTRLPLATRGGVVLLAPSEIRAVLIEGESVVLATDRGRFYTELRLSDLEEKLPAEHFLRVHRRALVNMRRVLRMETLATGGYLAHTDAGEAVPVSRKVARELRRQWGL
ncbi:MAG: two-component system LytT family response regulator [Myxococcota bacterium]|jgi:two-component system LytT family response regulator